MSEYIKMNDALIYNYQKDIIDEKDLEIERLNSIIKEVREYIENYCIDDEFEINLTFKERNIKKVLGILDKGSDKE